KKKLAGTVGLAVVANFFKTKIFFPGLKTAFCNRPFGKRTVKIDIFCISPCSPNGPSGPRRFCGVQVFSPEAKTLEQWWLCRPEY
ncbi:MAG: hypothetical protein KHX40_03115, partial [Oscillospiraceae bacterium]|nr:hypothetical protein [Oscillospiraceae bacterium]